jgi:hypothetical protein
MERKDVTFLLQTPSSQTTFVFFFLHAAYRRIFTAIDWSRGSGRQTDGVAAEIVRLLPPAPKTSPNWCWRAGCRLDPASFFFV